MRLHDHSVVFCCLRFSLFVDIMHRTHICCMITRRRFEWRGRTLEFVCRRHGECSSVRRRRHVRPPRVRRQQQTIGSCFLTNTHSYTVTLCPREQICALFARYEFVIVPTTIHYHVKLHQNMSSRQLFQPKIRK